MMEMVVAIGLLGLILGGLGVSLAGFARFNGVQWGRQQCLAAAQAQLDSITATGQPISDEDIARLWPDVKLTTDRQPGQDQWDGLERVQVSARIEARPRQSSVYLARYVPVTRESDQGGPAR